MNSNLFWRGFQGIHPSVVLLVLLWLAVNAADAVWLYFYVQARVDPNPRSAVNKTYSGFHGYEIMMFVFGFPWSIVNTAVAWNYFTWSFHSNWLHNTRGDGRRGDGTALTWVFNILVAFPIAVIFCIIPAFGGWIVVPLAQNRAWNHRCDDYMMFAILDGRGYKDARFVPNVVHFYQGSAFDPQPLFSYDISDNSDSDLWTFQLREFDVSQSLIPLDIYPTLQHVQYDFINDSLTGNCTVPTTLGSSITTSTSCMTGTFNPNDWFSLNITSSIPLNDSTSAPLTNTVLRTLDKQWSFSDDAPSLILRDLDPLTNALESTVLRTAVTKRGDCTQLKVCLAGSGRHGGLVGGEVMAPLGLIMMRQADYAFQCTTPQD